MALRFFSTSSKIFRGTLATIEACVDGAIERTALIVVGAALGADGFDESRLYAADYERRFRPRAARETSNDA